MKAVVLCLWLALLPPEDSLRVLFWNVENFFDWRNDSTSVSDAEFSSRGERHWTRKRFQAKCNGIAKGILWAASQEGGLPDVIGLAEVENAFVLRRLLQSTALNKLDYRIIHFDSPDPRGIDVALLYRKSRLKKADARPCHLFRPDSTLLTTRDILLAQFLTPGGDTVAMLVNHHPSKYGGTAASGPRRQIAVDRLRFLADSLQAAGIRHLVAVGDFNDTPASPLFARLQPALLPAYGDPHRGTIKFDGVWELIDLCFLSPSCRGTMQVLTIPFLQVPDPAHAGTKPFRTYSGPRYIGGVSDHCPVWVMVHF